MRFIQLMAAIIAAFCLTPPKPALADYFLCKEDRGELASPNVAKIAYKELLNTPYVSIGNKGPTRKVIYLLGSPWCPYCKRLYRLARSKKLNFEFRFLGMDPMSGTDFYKIADMILNGTEGLKRVYGSGSYSIPKNLNQATMKSLSDVALFSAAVFQKRYQPDVAQLYRDNNIQRATWGSPVLLAVRSDLSFGPAAFVGIPKLVLMSRSEDYGRHGYKSEREAIARHVMQPLSRARKQIIGGGNKIIKIYAFPSRNAPRLCFNDPLRVAGSIERKGKLWLKIKAIRLSNSRARGKPSIIHGYLPVN